MMITSAGTSSLIAVPFLKSFTLPTAALAHRVDGELAGLMQLSRTGHESKCKSIRATG